MADQDASRPYIGYRSAGRRPERQQDRRAAANAPLSALRGWAAGTAGIPGDIEALVRMLPFIERKDPVLPTSDFYKEWLPGRELNETPTGKAFTEAGSMTGGLGVGALSRIAAKGAGAVGRSGLEALHQAYLNPDNVVFKAVQPAFVVKPKGGNWLAGSVEESLKGLKRSDQGVLAPGIGITEDTLAAQNAPNRALNSWIDKQLTRYIKNEMATPEDPVRALAERGVSHLPLRDLEEGANWIPEDLGLHRRRAGFPEEGLAVAPAARGWEAAADTVMGSHQAGTVISPKFANSAYGSREEVAAKYLRENPWLAKVPPETPVYETRRLLDNDLGFPHLIDELRNALNPESGLPRELLLKYGSLERLSVPQAVERVAKINEWRAAQAAEANLAKAQNAATHVFKEYPTIPGTELPNERGLRWVELKGPTRPDDWRVPENFEIAPSPGKPGTFVVKMDGRIVSTGYDTAEAAAADTHRIATEGALADALKYEGETMGHCVGGYCDEVASGRSRIYSLRDAKGEPHVTVEVQPQTGDTKGGWEYATGELLKKYGDEAYDLGPGHPEFDALIKQYESSLPATQRIIQIKGKGNKAPAEAYLPFVQDFVKSGQWSDVGDLGNTGLVKLPDNRFITRQQFDEGAQALMPADDAPVSTDWLLRQIQRDPDWWERSKGAFEGYATGGLVEHSDTGYNPDRIDALAAQLRTELFA